MKDIKVKLLWSLCPFTKQMHAEDSVLNTVYFHNRSLFQTSFKTASSLSQRDVPMSTITSLTTFYLTPFCKSCFFYDYNHRFVNPVEVKKWIRYSGEINFEKPRTVDVQSVFMLTQPSFCNISFIALT